MRVGIVDLEKAKEFAATEHLEVVDYDDATKTAYVVRDTSNSDDIFLSNRLLAFVIDGYLSYMGAPSSIEGLDISSSFCGFCGKKHLRKHKAIIIHDGKACLIGGACFNVKGHLYLFYRQERRVRIHFNGNSQICWGIEPYLPRLGTSSEVEEIMKITHAVIEKYGFVSKVRGRLDQVSSTQQRVDALIDGSSSDTLFYPSIDILPMAKEWIKTQNTTSRMMSYCEAVLNMNIISSSHICLIVQKMAEDSDDTGSKSPLPEGEGRDVPGRWVCTSIRRFSGEYGDFRSARAVNRDGVGITFNLKKTCELVVGKELSIKGTRAGTDPSGLYRRLKRCTVSDISDPVVESKSVSRFTFIEV